MREVENGEIVIIENNKVKSIKPFPNKNQDLVFLNIFILQDQIVLLIINVHMNTERSLGNELAKETDI